MESQISCSFTLLTPVATGIKSKSKTFKEKSSLFSESDVVHHITRVTSITDSYYSSSKPTKLYTQLSVSLSFLSHVVIKSKYTDCEINSLAQQLSPYSPFDPSQLFFFLLEWSIFHHNFVSYLFTYERDLPTVSFEPLKYM